MAISFLASRADCRFTPQNHYYATGTHFCNGLSKPQSLLQPEELGNSIKCIHPIGSRTRDLPASVVLVSHYKFVCHCLLQADGRTRICKIYLTYVRF
jgi:hypothetical protein